MTPDRERITLQLAEVTRDRLGRFARLEFLRTCDPVAGCGVDQELADAIEGVDAFLETVELLVTTTEPDEVRELAGIVREYRRTLRDDLERIDELDDLDGDPAVLRRPTDRPAPLWVTGSGVGEYMDVSGLSGREASTLALVLNQWSNGGKKRAQPLYARRNGKRYIGGPSRLTVDLNHPAMAPFRDDLLAAMRDPDSAREFELEDGTLDVADDELAAAYLENARTRAGYEPKAARPIGYEWSSFYGRRRIDAFDGELYTVTTNGGTPMRLTAAELEDELASPSFGVGSDKKQRPPAAKKKRAPKKAPKDKPPSTQRPPIVTIKAAERVADEWRPSSIPAYDVGAYAVGRSLSDREARDRAGLERAGGSWLVYHKRTGFGAVTVRGSRRSALAAAWGFDRIVAELGDAGKFGTTDGIPRRWLEAGSKLAAAIEKHDGPLTYDKAHALARRALEKRLKG